MKNSESPDQPSRRNFIERVAFSAAALSLPSGLKASLLSSANDSTQPPARGF